MTHGRQQTADSEQWTADGVRFAASAVLALAAVKLVVHLATTGRFGYGYFIDEFYFLACSEHLDWGYVDMPPLFPAFTALVRFLIGDSLFALRLVSALAGAGLVVLTGFLAREMGGGRFAQALAALAVVVAPIYLAMSSLYTMNFLEPLLWMGCVYVLLRLANGADPRLWLAFGVLAGLGMLNKNTTGMFGVGVVVGLALTPMRRHFRSPWLWLGGAVAFLLFLPNLAWMVLHDFPHLEMLENIRANGRNVPLSPLQFLLEQVMMMHPLALPLWLGGLVWLLVDRDGRRYGALGVTYLVVLGLLFVLDGRVYYLAPAYPMLFAGGAVAADRWLASRRLEWPKYAYATLLVVTGAALAPLVLPCLPPETYVAYTRATGLEQPRIETHRLGPLPQLHADRFGWPEMVDVVARIYHALPPEERAKAAIFGQNYGQAGAVDHFGPALGLPKALSGHLSYHDWGPREYTGEVMIVLDDDRETLEGIFERVELAGRVEHPYSMPYEHFDVFVCRGPRMPLGELWPRVKKYS